MNILYIITIYNTKTGKGIVKSTTWPEDIGEYNDGLDKNEVMFVNEVEKE